MDTEQQYIKGFNTGYLLTKYEFLLLNQLEKNLPVVGDFFQGLFSGKQEVEREYIRDPLNELKLFRTQLQSKERDAGQEID